MNSNDYDIYIRGVIALVRTFIIKSEQNIAAMNILLTQYGHHISDDPREWKYYKNLAGEYYSDVKGARLMNDEMMYVTSLDDLSTIPFTKDSLLVHRFTRQEYSKRERFYEELVDRYPEQLDLINGILNPLDVDVAINAKDFSILYHDASLVGENEITLIPAVERWLQTVSRRWLNDNYLHADPYYAVNFLGCLVPHIVGEVINQHWHNLKTPYVNEFYIWEHLGGYFDLDRYKNSIPNNVALWLYRNIDDLSHNLGSAETLRYLYEELVLPTGVKLKQYDIGRNKDSLVMGTEENLTVEVTDIAKSLTDSREYSNLYTLATKLNKLGLTNNTLIYDDMLETVRRYRSSDKDDTKSTVIEAVAENTTASGYVAYIVEALTTWIYLTNKGHYDLLISVPVPGDRNIQLNMEQAVNMFFLCADRLAGGTAVEFPKFHLMGIPDPEKFASENELKAFVTAQIERTFMNDDKYVTFRNLVPSIEHDVTNLKDFSEIVDSIVRCKLGFKLLANKMVDESARVQMEIASTKFMKTVEIDLASIRYSNFNQFKEFLRIDERQWTMNDWYTMAISILEQSINYRLTADSMPSPYAEIVDIVRLLTRYTTKIVTSYTGVFTDVFEYPDFNRSPRYDDGLFSIMLEGVNSSPTVTEVHEGVSLEGVAFFPKTNPLNPVVNVTDKVDLPFSSIMLENNTVYTEDKRIPYSNLFSFFEWSGD